MNAKDLERQLLAELSGIETTVKKGVTRKDLDDIGSKVVQEMKKLIATGLSPIAGRGRFPGYVGQGDKRRYPGSVKSKHSDKRDRPVNLTLSGDFLKKLTSVATVGANKISIAIGFKDPLSVKKEQGHRDGANGQPERPVIPDGSERFTPAIETILLDGFQAVINRILRNKK